MSSNDVLVFDLEDEDEPPSFYLPPPIGAQMVSLKSRSNLVPLEIISQLDRVIFGNAVKHFPTEWKIQSFKPSESCNLPYGIVQKKGGPCGLLACIQAYLIKHLYFEENLQVVNKECCHEALSYALANVLWKAGDLKKTVVVIPFGKCSRIDGLRMMNFDSLFQLKIFFKESLSLYTDEESQSCIAYLYSAILSRGIHNIKMDMDDSSCCSFLGAHGYCTQEMINLLLTGRATSNAFDDFITLDAGTVGNSVLKGVSRQSDIGLLSLFEHYNSFLVGSNLKNPLLPIWIICSESHFSVLFSKGSISNSSQSFDLFYYDGLINQDTEIKLTINTSGGANVDGDLISPIEHCIRTKWKCAHVNWNGAEPLL